MPTRIDVHSMWKIHHSQMISPEKSGKNHRFSTPTSTFDSHLHLTTYLVILVMPNHWDNICVAMQEKTTIPVATPICYFICNDCSHMHWQTMTNTCWNRYSSLKSLIFTPVTSGATPSDQMMYIYIYRFKSFYIIVYLFMYTIQFPLHQQIWRENNDML